MDIDEDPYLDFQGLALECKVAETLHRVRRHFGGTRFAFAPSVDQCLGMIRELEVALGGESDAVQVIGPSIITVRSWKRRKRMSVPARRLVWLVWALILHPEDIRTVWDLITWGNARVKAPAS